MIFKLKVSDDRVLEQERPFLEALGFRFYENRDSCKPWNCVYDSFEPEKEISTLEELVSFISQAGGSLRVEIPNVLVLD